MDIHTGLETLLSNYSSAKLEEFSNHPIANFIRHNLAESVRKIVNNDEKYFVKGSSGQGGWADVPWVGVFDRLITETAQDGYYIVYLLHEDGEGIHLSLNQGVSNLARQYGVDAKKALQTKAADYLARLGGLSDGYIKGPIDLAAGPKSRLGKLYEAGSICSIYYPKNQLPNSEVLEADLENLVNVYFQLTVKEPSLYQQSEIEDDETNLGVEDLRLLRVHKRMDRNAGLAKKAKRIHGYVCAACGFDFEQAYGAIGKEFIEAHHLTPLHKLKGQLVTLDPQKDFAVLCSNCHKMIHKSEFVDDVGKFKKKYLR